ncbi:MAG: DEAD/DEAH box helicase, partial [Rhabdochlamydiaceae bacterium]
MLRDYQEKAVAKLRATALDLLRKGGSRVCVFKAPTGSGKTIMVAELLRQLAETELPGRYVYLWISSNKLHEQSMEKVSAFLEDSRYSFFLLEDVADTKFEENQVIFVNWEKLAKQDRRTGDFTSVLMRNTETGRDLPSLVANSKDAGLGIILIVDESHSHYWTERSQGIVQEVLAPNLVLEVSATPVLVPPQDDIFKQEAGFVLVDFDEVRDGGMIKCSTIINEGLSEESDAEKPADDVIISAALEKREELAELYKQEGSSINPLVLIQLPSESQSMSALDQSKFEQVRATLATEHDITVENGRLAVWLSDRKDNTENISDAESPVEVLIFKQAIALGWDCPRAQILIMFRDIRSVTFEIQTVGRILRMPELKHYETDALNQAYVYTNLDHLIATDSASQGFFKMHGVVRKKEYVPIDLPSIYLSRIDYGALTLSFRRAFDEEANHYFGISSDDMPSIARAKAEKRLEVLPANPTRFVLSDAIIANLDVQRGEILGRDSAEFGFSPDEVKRGYEAFAKATCRPYAPARSHTKIQQGIYD